MEKHLQETVATAKGHLDRKRKNFRPTEHEYKIEEISPTQEEKTNKVFASYLATDTEGVMYTDLKGKFPVTSIDGYKYILVLYHYDTNVILTKPLRNRSDQETLRAYKELYNELNQNVFNIKLHIMDNESSKAL